MLINKHGHLQNNKYSRTSVNEHKNGSLHTT
jgi:hypothetical protein